MHQATITSMLSKLSSSNYDFTQQYTSKMKKKNQEYKVIFMSLRKIYI